MTIYALTPPPSVNHLYPTIRGRRVKSREYKAWIEAAGWELKNQRAKPVKGPVAVWLRVPENGRRDLDGYLKPTLDLLVSMKLIEGDRCKTIRHIAMNWHDQPAMLVEWGSWKL